jgi:hypothetical protein
MSASSVPVGVEAVECGRGGLEVARHHRAASEPNSEPAYLSGFRPVEGLPVGGDCHRVADRVEQVAAQRQRGGAVRAGCVRHECVDERERVSVGTDRRLRLGGA